MDRQSFAIIAPMLFAPKPPGYTLHFNEAGEATNETTPAFPCGWDERDALV